jgi:hypothetical protein
MIVNRYSVIMTFMSALGLILAAVLAATAVLVATQIIASRRERDNSRVERTLHLVTLLSMVFLIVATLSWGMFYAMLNSFVPEVPGAMCIYGVTRVMPAATAFIQIAKPLVIFVLGGCLLIEHVRRQSGLAFQRPTSMFALAFVAVCAAFVSGAELHYVFNMTSLNEVSCCSRGSETPGGAVQQAAYYLPWQIPAAQLQVLLNIGFFVGTPLLATWLLWRSHRQQTRYTAVRVLGSGLLLLGAIALAAVSLVEFKEVLSPLLMRLPFHHCLYCLLSNSQAPDAPLIAGNLAVGVLCTGWAGIVWGADGMQSPPACQLHRRLCHIGAVTLLASVLMVGIHLALI